MEILAFLIGVVCALVLTSPVSGLTGQEGAYFDSEEIPLSVDGELFGQVQFRTIGGIPTLTSNGIPDHALGTVTNDQLVKKDYTVEFPQNPSINENATCLPAYSIIGFATNGVAIFSPFHKNESDINEVDFGGRCQDGITDDGIYYYAQNPGQCQTFIPGFRGHDPNRIYGVAIDGFPIYGPGEGDTKITNADLDGCHGKMVDGQYRYYMTNEWPYVLGCFRGTPVTVQGAPPPSDVCKFACNTDAVNNDVSCVDDFIPTTESPPPTTGEASRTNYSIALLLSAVISLCSNKLF